MHAYVIPNDVVRQTLVTLVTASPKESVGLNWTTVLKKIILIAPEVIHVANVHQNSQR